LNAVAQVKFLLMRLSSSLDVVGSYFAPSHPAGQADVLYAQIAVSLKYDKK